jgi:hypothetical protein
MSAQDAGASRFFLPDERSQAAHQRPAPPPPGYAPSQPYNSGGYDPHGGGQHEPYVQHSGYAQEGWHDEEQAYHGREQQGGGQLMVTHGDELDEDFFGDEDDYGHEEHGARKGGRKKLVAAAVAAALVAGGGAYYLKSSGGGDKRPPVIHADSRPSKEAPGNPGGKQFPNGEKAIYERLRPDGTTQVAAAALGPSPIIPASASPSVTSPGNSLEDRIDEALKKARKTGDAPPAGRSGSDQPTVVPSETYTPDGRRVDAARPVITPSISSVNSGGGLPYPFGNAPATVTAQPAAPAPFKIASAPPPAAPQQQLAPAMAAPPPAPKGAAPRVAARAAPTAIEPAAAPAAPAGSFYVSLKSAPDEKAMQRDLPALSDKYKSVLGDVQLSTKIYDLGAKGVTYRAIAGPLGTKQEAMDLCQKIKGVGGDKACFVTN